MLEDGKRAFIVGRADEERVCELADVLLGQKLHAGDHLLFDTRSGLLARETSPSRGRRARARRGSRRLYDDVGGLDEQIERSRTPSSCRTCTATCSTSTNCSRPKGILLYGPPGCGKTLIAKAVANSLAKRVAEKTGNASARSYFLNIKGPELLNKYVGETERQIRLIFQRAREKSEEGYPVIVFFDEMDSLFRTRGTGISLRYRERRSCRSCSPRSTVSRRLKNVIVIGASNREDLIDPAILRPGRLDVKIKIERPDEESATKIFRQYLTPNLPLAESELKTADGDRGRDRRST